MPRREDSFPQTLPGGLSGTAEVLHRQNLELFPGAVPDTLKECAFPGMQRQIQRAVLFRGKMEDQVLRILLPFRELHEFSGQDPAGDFLSVRRCVRAAGERAQRKKCQKRIQADKTHCRNSFI